MFDKAVDGADAGGDWSTVAPRKKKRRQKKREEQEQETQEPAVSVPNNAAVQPPSPEVDEPGAVQEPISPPVRKPTRPPMKQSGVVSPAHLASPVVQQQQEPSPAKSSPSSDHSGRKAAYSKSPPMSSLDATKSPTPQRDSSLQTAPTNGAKKKAKKQEKDRVQAQVVEDEDGFTTVVNRKKLRRRQRNDANKAPEDEEDDDQDIDAPVAPVASATVPTNFEEVNSNGASTEDKKPGKKKRKRKKKAAAPPPPASDQIETEEQLINTITRIINTHGAKGKISQNDICKQLELQTKKTWKHFKLKHGPMRQFLESSGFSVDSNSNSCTIGLRKSPSNPSNPEASSGRKPSPPSSKGKAPPPDKKAKPPPDLPKSSQDKDRGKDTGKKPPSSVKSRPNKRKGKKNKLNRQPAQKASPPTRTQGPSTSSWTNTIGLIVVGCASVAALVIGGTKMGGGF